MHDPDDVISIIYIRLLANKLYSSLAERDKNTSLHPSHPFRRLIRELKIRQIYDADVTKNCHNYHSFISRVKTMDCCW
jgi:hypothetical protein